MSELATNRKETRYEVSPIELFFDLVFAFAISQFSHHLLVNPTLRGVAETAVMLIAVLTVWSHTSWAATMIPVDQKSTRWMILIIMLLGLFMNASIRDAFGDACWLFVIPYLLSQFGRTIWVIRVSDEKVIKSHYIRLLIWLVGIAPIWIVGCFASSEIRIYWWALAAIIDQVGTWLAHPIPGMKLESENVEFDADHLLERCSLFLLIALGETVLTTGAAISSTRMQGLDILTGVFAFLATVSLWALSFGRTSQLVDEHIEKTNDPIFASRHGMNTTIVMVAGLIATAVANEKIISHPQGESDLSTQLFLYGGPSLFLLAIAWYSRKVLNQTPRLYVIGALALAVLGIVTFWISSTFALCFVGVALNVISVFERRLI